MKPLHRMARSLSARVWLAAALAWLAASLGMTSAASAATWTSPPEEIAALTRKPLLVLYEHDPWMFIVGSDQVSFAIYEDGLVLFRRHAKDLVTTFEAHLPPPRAVALATRWAATLHGAPDHFAVVHASDHPTAVVVFRQALEWSMRSAYGFVREDQRIAIPSASSAPLRYGQHIRTAPERIALDASEQRFRDVYAELVAFDPDDERVWRPDELELLFQDLGTKGAGYPWPAALPALPGSLVDHAAGRVTRCVIPAASERQIESFRRQLKGRAIRYAGRDWRMHVRSYAPDEAYVQKVMSALGW